MSPVKRDSSVHAKASILNYSPMASIGQVGDELLGRFGIPVFGMDGEDGLAGCSIGKRKQEFPVEAPGAPQRRVDRIQTIRSSNHDHLKSGILITQQSSTTPFFFNKKTVYKNIQAEIPEKIRTCSASILGEKIYFFIFGSKFVMVNIKSYYILFKFTLYYNLG